MSSYTVIFSTNAYAFFKFPTKNLDIVKERCEAATVDFENFTAGGFGGKVYDANDWIFDICYIPKGQAYSVAKFINTAMIPVKVEANSIEEAVEKARDVFTYPDIIDDNVNMGQVEFEKKWWRPHFVRDLDGSYVEIDKDGHPMLENA